MSRPLRFVLPVLIPVVALTFSSCFGTIYDHTYSYHRNYFKPPEEKKDASVENILGALDKKSDTNLPLGDVPPAPTGLPAPDVPGMPPAGLPPADPNAMPPAAPGAPAVPGAPPAPAIPPAVPPPAK